MENKRKRNKVELLLPAGNLETLKVAIRYGADAVYIGGQAYGLRAKADNFSIEDMKAAAEYAHAHGKKVYLTANIYAHNYDIDGVRKYFICQNDKGEKVSIQSRITAYWQDGSVKWSAHTADAERLGSHITMELSDTKPDMEMQNPVKIKEDDNGFCIHTKNMILHIAKKGNNLIDTAVINNVTRLKNVHPVLQLEEPMNWNEEEAHIVKSYTGVIEQVRVEECGELMIVIRYEGCHVNRKWFALVMRVKKHCIGADSSSFVYFEF